MNILPVIGILILMLLVISGYVSTSANEDTQATRAQAPPWHGDPHLNYYEEHLTKMGVERR